MNASNPELQRILAALKGSSLPELQPSSSSHANNSSNTYSQYVSNNGYSPHGSNSSGSLATKQPFQIPGLGNELTPAPVLQQRPTTTPAPTADPRLRSATQAPAPTRSQTSTPVPPTPDASSIITWPAAIKHITKHIIPNEVVSKSIIKLIDSQHTHEETWAKQREEIIARHAGRGESTAKIAGLLAELGGGIVTNANATTETEEAREKRSQERDKELEMFDRKVYKNLVAMSRDVDKELRRLGVPFFAIKWDLVSETGGQGKLDKGELRELQGKVTEHLELLLID